MLLAGDTHKHTHTLVIAVENKPHTHKTYANTRHHVFLLSRFNMRWAATLLSDTPPGRSGGGGAAQQFANVL